MEGLYSIDSLLKASQIILNVKQSLPSDSLGIIPRDNTKEIIDSIEQAALKITKELNEIYTKH